MSSATERPAFDGGNAFATNLNTTGLMTPYNVPKTVNILLRSNRKVLLGAIAIDNLRCKLSPSNISGWLIVSNPNDFAGRSSLVAKQQITFKANAPAMGKHVVDLISPVVINPDKDYRLRFVFDNSWVPRNFYCLTKIIQYDTHVSEAIKISIVPEKFHGDTIENELPLILFFNKL